MKLANSTQRHSLIKLLDFKYQESRPKKKNQTVMKGRDFFLAMLMSIRWWKTVARSSQNVKHSPPTYFLPSQIVVWYFQACKISRKIEALRPFFSPDLSVFLFKVDLLRGILFCSVVQSLAWRLFCGSVEQKYLTETTENSSDAT